MFVSRQHATTWAVGSDFLPSGWELSAHLAATFEFPDQVEHDLLRVAAYIEAVAGRATLYDELRKVFAADYATTPLHTFLAKLPARREPDSLFGTPQVVVTTNYDDMMEQAFAAAGEPYDVVWYVADGQDRGRFLHRRHQGDVKVIETVREYQDIDLTRRSVVLKLHGSVDRLDASRDSYVITHDDYIEYLIRADFSLLLPQALVARLYSSQFLFLGYGMRDWNLQVILHRMWREQKLASKSWAVQPYPDSVDQILWERRNVELIDAHLDEYLACLSDRLGNSQT